MAFEKRLPVSCDGPIGMIFFEAQTGIYRRDDWKSNFYHYRLRNSHPATNQYTSDWLDENISKSVLQDGEWRWPGGFLADLATAEEAADRDVERLLALAPESMDQVPQNVS